MERRWCDAASLVAMDSGLAAEPVIGPRFARTRWRRPAMTAELLLHLGQHLLRDAHRIEHHRRAGIEADMQEDLADLLAGDAIGDRAAHVAAQLVVAVQDSKHRKIEHAARLAA